MGLETETDWLTDWPTVGHFDIQHMDSGDANRGDLWNVGF
jgi:hypothetical protein